MKEQVRKTEDNGGNSGRMASLLEQFEAEVIKE
jgi:hypothetical protein